MTQPVAVTAEDLQALRRFDTPTVCNVIELFDVRPRHVGFTDGRIKCLFPEFAPMVGYAATATFRSDGPPREGDAYTALDRQLASLAEVPAPAVVVFQDLDNPPKAATFGEVMCTAYQRFGAVGVVTSGGARDLEQIRNLGFPAFASEVICSHGYCRILEVNVPVHVGGMTIFPGDLLHADRNGVATIPAAIAADVAKACAEFVAAEEEVLGYLRHEPPTVEGFRAARARMAERIAGLTERVRRV